MSLLDSLLDQEGAKIGTNEVYIAIRTDIARGAGTKFDPYNGSTDTLLDNILGSLGPNLTVRFGPGIFQTKGLGGAPNGWSAKAGQT